MESFMMQMLINIISHSSPVLVINLGSQSQVELASEIIAWDHCSHVPDVRERSAFTLALAAQAKTNVSLGLPAQIPACGEGYRR